MAGAEEFRVKLTGEVDVATVQASIDQKVEPKLKPVKLKAEIDETSLQKQINSLTGVSGLSGKKASDSAGAIKSLKEGAAYADEFQAKLKNLYETDKITEDQFKNFSAIVSQMTNQFKNAEVGITDFKEQLKALDHDVTSASVAFDKAKKAQNEYNLELARTQKRANMVEKQTSTFQTRLNNLKQTGLLTNKQFENFSSRLSDIKKKFEDGKSKTGDFQLEMTKLKNEVSETSTKMGHLGQRLIDVIAKFTKWYLVAGLVTSMIRGIKNLISAATELDASMIELGKVWDADSEEMNKFKDRAYAVAKELGGTTGKAIIDATTEFKRMGYTIEESLDLAKAASIMITVAEGINSTSDAANILISTLKGVGASSEYAMSLLDRLNEVSNKNAISFDALAEMLQESAATMKILGNNVDETIGLLTGAFEILQDQKVAKGIQTIGLRIAGLNEDLEAEAGLSNQVVEALQKYANISAFDAQSGQLKSTYQILEELAGVWDKINKNEQTALLNTLAGKRQADVAASILSNWEGVSKAVEDAQNSMGSALDEHQKALNSVQAAQEELQNAIQELSKTLIDSGIIQWLLDAAKAFIEFLKSMIAWIDGCPPAVKWILAISSTLVVLGVAIASAIGALTGPVGLIAAVAAGAVAIASFSSIAKDAKENTDKLTESIIENNSEYKDLSELYSDVNNQTSNYDNLINKLKESIKALNKENQKTLELLRKEQDELKETAKLQDKLYAVEKARQELAEAKNKRLRVFRAGKGFVYEQDSEAIQSAQENLTSALNSLAEYRYETILSRAEDFVTKLNEILSGDNTTFIDSWEALLNEFSDLLGTDFEYVIKDALEQYGTPEKLRELRAEEEAARERDRLAAEEKKRKDIETYFDATKKKSDIISKSSELLDTDTSKMSREELNKKLSELYATNKKNADDYYYLSQKMPLKTDREAYKIRADRYQSIADSAAALLKDNTSKLDTTISTLGEKYKDEISYIIINKLTNALDEAMNRILGTFGTNRVKENASGTTNFAGGTTLVGEHGPELVNLPAGSEILSHNKSMKLNSIVSNPSAFVGGAGRNTTLQFNGDLSFPNVRNANDAQGFLAALMQIGNKGLAKF